jgi:hypothetical protein
MMNKAERILRLTIFFTLRPPVRSSLVLAGLCSHSVARLRTQPAKLAVVKNLSLGEIGAARTDNSMTEALTTEFDRIKDCIIYFDWNVISYLTGLTEIADPKLMSQCLLLERQLKESIDRDRCALPYSLAHFLDIRQGNRDTLGQKIEKLASFSRGWTLHEDLSNGFALRLDKCIDVQAHFDWYDNSLAATTELDPNLWPLLDNTADFFRELSSMMPTQEWEVFLERLADCIRNPNDGLETLRLNKEMRHAKSPVQGFDIKYPHLDSTVLNRRANDLKGLVNDALERSTFPFHVVEEFFALTHPHKITVLSDFENDILRLVSLSEFLGISSEKLKKKTAFSSISTDMKHMVYGLRSNILVSHDRNFRRKALFIASWLGLSTRILDIAEFTEIVAV